MKIEDRYGYPTQNAVLLRRRVAASSEVGIAEEHESVYTQPQGAEMYDSLSTLTHAVTKEFSLPEGVIKALFAYSEYGALPETFSPYDPYEPHDPAELPHRFEQQRIPIYNLEQLQPPPEVAPRREPFEREPSVKPHMTASNLQAVPTNPTQTDPAPWSHEAHPALEPSEMDPSSSELPTFNTMEFDLPIVLCWPEEEKRTTDQHPPEVIAAPPKRSFVQSLQRWLLEFPTQWRVLASVLGLYRSILATFNHTPLH